MLQIVNIVTPMSIKLLSIFILDGALISIPDETIGEIHINSINRDEERVEIFAFNVSFKKEQF